jgi:hypothetical protein
LFAKINIGGKKDNESDDEKDFVKNIVEFKTDMESLQKVDFFHQVQKFTPILGDDKSNRKKSCLGIGRPIRYL